MFEIGTVIADAAGAVPSGLLETFGVQWQLLLIQSLNFLCVVAILYFFAFKPVLKTMEERKSKIESGLQYAEEMRLQLESSDAAIRDRLGQAKEEAHQIMEEARRQSEIYSDKQKAEMEQLTQGMLDGARRNIAEEKAKMFHDLKSEVKTLVTDIAAKVLAKELSLAEHKRYLDEIEIQLHHAGQEKS
ncbi:MAG: F0F1 ATP synthase subunit B [Puniceicoccales bacterium]|jgi:F-type H+-transporting ATPase subunit b|nr:F0F1 ATP synthase subunit B [Puniceicoccales bacterium]